jgi:hypothetical protein
VVVLKPAEQKEKGSRLLLLACGFVWDGKAGMWQWLLLQTAVGGLLLEELSSQPWKRRAAVGLLAHSRMEQKTSSDRDG